MTSSWLRLYANVLLGDGAQLDEFVILGKPPRGKKDGELALVIGAGAVIRSHTVIYAGNIIGAGLQTGHHVTIREENHIGTGVSVGTGSIIEHHVRIGDGVRLHSRVFVPEMTILEDGCWLGPGVVITNARYPLSKGVKENLVGARIEKGAKIGANATLLPGVRIGERALIGAGSVVTKDVPANAVMAGNPAGFIRWIDDIEEYG